MDTPSHSSSYPKRLASEAEIAASRGHFRFLETLLESPFPLHWHEFYEVSLILAGKGVNSLNGIEQPLGPGSIFFLTPVDFHAIYPLEGPLKIYNLIFTDEMLSDEIRDILMVGSGEHALAAQLTGEQFSQVQALYEDIDREGKTMRPGYQILVHGAIERILIQVSRHSISDQLESNNLMPLHSGIRKALFYLQYHFREPIDLRTIAGIASLAPHYFSELFHTQVGKTFQDYLVALRISLAGKLLRSTRMPVTEICFQSGIGSISQFDRAFKRQFGCSPRTYRLSFTQKEKESL